MNGELYHVGHPHQKRPVDCRKFWKPCVEIAWTQCVVICDGNLDEIILLVAIKTFINEPVDLPIGTFAVNLTREDSLGDEFCAFVEM